MSFTNNILMNIITFISQIPYNTMTIYGYNNFLNVIEFSTASLWTEKELFTFTNKFLAKENLIICLSSASYEINFNISSQRNAFISVGQMWRGSH